MYIHCATPLVATEAGFPVAQNCCNSYSVAVKTTVRNIAEKINKSSFRGIITFDEKMADHTTFRVGGAADLYVKPENEASMIMVMQLVSSFSRRDLPRFLLGGGANIVVSDKGIRGIVIDLTSLDALRIEEPLQDRGRQTVPVHAEGGCSVDRLCDEALSFSLTGAEFLAGMPGSVGGALWMNARCYGSSVSDIVHSYRFLDGTGTVKEVLSDPTQFSYKKSPFQNKPELVILSACLHLHKGEPAHIRERMAAFREDRNKKGHYRYPSAGSVFKNNRSFGESTGVLLDRIGMKGTRVGGAQVAEYHANIIINTGSATASDIRTLVEKCSMTAHEKLGIDLEPEIRFVGDWS
jgi:UDP-N-acetylmuramate dehydrogenase